MHGMPQKRSWPEIPEARRIIMRSNKAKDTSPELAVRRLLHALGYRFRLHRQALPGTPDIVLPGRRKVIQVHGCFWHQHEGCRHGSVPATRQDYWIPKLARNKERDRQVEQKLAELGWTATTIWECELRNLPALAARIGAFLGPPGRGSARSDS